MKKLFILVLAAMVVLGVTLSAQAALITFDEPGIAMGDTISTQYAALGINWVNSPANTITTGPSFSNPFSSDGQILQYSSKPAEGDIQLDFLSNYLAFEYRRPSASGDIHVALYNTGSLVYEDTFTWNSGVWDTFVYAGAGGAFDRIVMDSSNKFVIDNLEVNAVPIPSTFFLLAPGVLVLIRRRLLGGTK